MKTLLFILVLLPLLKVVANNNPCDTCTVVDSIIIDDQHVSSNFIKKFYLHSQLDQFLSNYQENIIYQIETTGDFSQTDPFVFSFFGNSYQWNKYYYNQVRINDCFFPGNSLYKPLMNNTNLEIDQTNSSLLFSSDSIVDSYTSLQLNFGGLGGTSLYYEKLIHLYHRTATEALYKPVPDRRRVIGSANFTCQTTLSHKNKKLPQTFSFISGQRILPDIKFDGIREFFSENYMQFQASGELPVLLKLFDKNYYLFFMQNRSGLFSEKGYSKEETADFSNANISYTGVKSRNSFFISSGLNFSLKKIVHTDLNFSRNIVDQDGEGFEPWYTDANVFELSHSLVYNKKLIPHVFFTINSFNACLINAPITNNFYNSVYLESVNQKYTSLYVYKWNAHKFATGLLENTAGINTEKSFLKDAVTLKASADFTFDGIVIKDKSIMKPSWQASGSLVLKPLKFVELSIKVGRNRVPFNYDLVRFLSNDYLNGEIYYWNDTDNNREFSNTETGNLFSTTGGKYHALDKQLKQPDYYFLEIPLHIKFLKTHTLSLYCYYKKYIHNWYVEYSLPLEQNTFSEYNNEEDWFFMLPQKRSYTVVQFNLDHMQLADNSDILRNSPFSQGYTIKYQKLGKKLFFSASWTDYLAIGYSALDNGVYTNSMGVLSESQANPNTKFHNTGQLDTDRSYIGRLLLSYKISKKITTAFQFLYRDGQPVSFFKTQLYTDANETQVAIQHEQSKGGNILTGASGSREDAFFNTELRFEYSALLFKHALKTNISMYNLYDMGTELNEYSFAPVDKERFTLELSIPRGLIISVQYFF